MCSVCIGISEVYPIKMSLFSILPQFSAVSLPLLASHAFNLPAKILALRYTILDNF